MNPYYMGIALDFDRKKVAFLGFRQTTPEIDALALERAPGLPWTCITMTQPSKKVAQDIEDWFTLRGLDPIIAKRLVSDFALQLAAKMEVG